jgi:hypothetical protein
MAFDKNLLMRDGATAGNLTANGNGAAVDLWQGVAAGTVGLMTFAAYAPQATGTSPTLDIKIQGSDNGTSGWKDMAAFRQITAAKQEFVTFRPWARYVRAVWTVGGTSPNFGAVTIGPVLGGQAGRY